MVFPILGSGLLASGYEISNSLRFDSGSSGLSKTFSSDGNRKKFTIAKWLKVNASFGYIAGTQTGSSDYFQYGFTSSRQIRVWQGDGSLNVTTTRTYGDPSAWYHIVLQVDTTQETDTNRVKFYINGEQETSYSETTYPSRNLDLFFNKDTHAFGVGNRGDFQGGETKGYFADFYFVDNATVAPSTFGETNDNGVWIPKDSADVIDAVTFGTNGFFMNFQQTGTSANSSGMGADTSGNDNHFAATNLVAADQCTDTPTNNFMTWNPLYTNSKGTFAEGNCQVTTGVRGSAPYGQVEFGSFCVNSGKWYFEVEVAEVGSGGSLGLGANERAYEGTYVNGHNNGGSPGNIRYNNSSGNVNNGSSTAVSGAATYTDDDTIGFAMDLDNNKMYIHKNGTYINSGDPAAGSNGITMTSSYSDYWTPWVSKDDTNYNAKVYLNTGNPVLANDSGNADDNGYGDFEYDVPTGFYALCTKNLAEYG